MSADPLPPPPGSTAMRGPTPIPPAANRVSPAAIPTAPSPVKQPPIAPAPEQALTPIHEVTQAQSVAPPATPAKK